jgi:hypothetical protein
MPFGKLVAFGQLPLELLNRGARLAERAQRSVQSPPAFELRPRHFLELLERARTVPVRILERLGRQRASQRKLLGLGALLLERRMRCTQFLQSRAELRRCGGVSALCRVRSVAELLREALLLLDERFIGRDRLR